MTAAQLESGVCRTISAGPRMRDQSLTDPRAGAQAPTATKELEALASRQRLVLAKAGTEQ